MTSKTLAQCMEQAIQKFLNQTLLIYKQFNMSAYLQFDREFKVLTAMFIPYEKQKTEGKGCSRQSEIQKLQSNMTQEGRYAEERKQIKQSPKRIKKKKSLQYLEYQDENMNKLIEWINQEINKNNYVTKKKICEKAKELYRNLKANKYITNWYLLFLNNNPQIQKKLAKMKVQKKYVQSGYQPSIQENLVFGFSKKPKNYPIAQEKVSKWLLEQLKQDNIPTDIMIGHKYTTQVKINYGIKVYNRTETHILFLRRNPILRQKLRLARELTNNRQDRKNQQPQIFIKESQIIEAFKKRFPKICSDEAHSLIYRLDPNHTGKIITQPILQSEFTKIQRQQQKNSQN